MHQKGVYTYPFPFTMIDSSQGKALPCSTRLMYDEVRSKFSVLVSDC